jgi:hypothetical protein
MALLHDSKAAEAPSPSKPTLAVIRARMPAPRMDMQERIIGLLLATASKSGARLPALISGVPMALQSLKGALQVNW